VRQLYTFLAFIALIVSTPDAAHMEGVTLIESGTSRRHFALLKQVELAKSDAQADGIVVSTIAEIRSALSSQSFNSLSSPSLASYLLVLLQCLESFPNSSINAHTQPSIQFALVPGLHLLSTATKANELLLAYAFLRKITAAQDVDGQQQTSLLVLNSIRKHLEAGFVECGKVGKGKGKSRSPVDANVAANRLSFLRISFALKSIVAGFPSGPDIFPALYGPVSLLCRHQDEGIQSLALDSLRQLGTYLDHDESIERANWERARAMLSRYEKGRKTGITTGQSLPRALLRSIKRAVEASVISADLACEWSIALLEARPELSLASLKNWLATIKNFGGGEEILEKVKAMIADRCIDDSDDYSTLLSGARLLGEVADVGQADDPKIKAIWVMILGHLHTKNANRIMLVLSCLEALLPYSWPAADNRAGLELGDTDMNAIMGLLGHRDESIRRRVSASLTEGKPTLKNSADQF
jgi:hypothetical protein